MKKIFVILSCISLNIFSANSVDQAIAKIDSLIQRNLESSMNQKSDDSTFVRRIYLDVIGRIPSIEESEKFINDKTSNKRSICLLTALRLVFLSFGKVIAL